MPKASTAGACLDCLDIPMRNCHCMPYLLHAVWALFGNKPACSQKTGGTCCCLCQQVSILQ